MFGNKMGVVADKNDDKESNTCFPVRYVQVLMMFLALMMAFCVRVIMSIAIVAMTDPNNENSFNWSIQRQSVILSSFTWGYMILQGISGELASKFGGRNLVIFCVAGNSISSLLMPTMAMYGGWIAVCFCRGLQGLTQGVILACMHYLISKWIPLEEKSRVTGFVFAGAQFGIGAQLVVSGFIADYWGWEAIFYVNGCIGIVWIVVYLIIGSDSPQVSRLISAEERLRIQSSLGHIGGHKRLKTPWKAIFTSLPFISVIAANIGNNWGFWTLLTELPTFINQVLGMNIKSNGVLSALPYITMSLMNFPVGFASDYALKKNWVSVTACRKISNSIGFFGPALGLILLSYVPAGSVTLAVLVLVATFALHAGFYNGYILSILDMAPNFASNLMGLSNFFSNVVSLFAPLTVGFVLEDETNPKEWRIVFFIAAAIYIFTNIFYIIFGTSEQQKWNEDPGESPKA